MSQAIAGILQLECLVSQLPPFRQNFAKDLINQYRSRGKLSDRQAEWIPRLIDMANQNAEKIEKIQTSAPQVQNFERIIQIFDTAREKAHKSPVVRFGDSDAAVKLSEAKEHSQNAGMIYVTLNGDYKGKISRDGRWQVSGGQDENLLAKLSEFVLDPLEMMKRFGYATGKCSVCNRKLTDKTSIANGIGPICSENMGF